MSYLISSADVCTKTKLKTDAQGALSCDPISGNIGSLPTLFNQDGTFNHEANSYLFYQKAINQAKVSIHQDGVDGISSAGMG